MTLITSAQRLQLLANAKATRDADQRGGSIDHYPVVKLFTPDAQCTWLLSEIDVDDQDCAFIALRSPCSARCPAGPSLVRRSRRTIPIVGLSLRRRSPFAT